MPIYILQCTCPHSTPLWAERPFIRTLILSYSLRLGLIYLCGGIVVHMAINTMYYIEMLISRVLLWQTFGVQVYAGWYCAPRPSYSIGSLTCHSYNQAPCCDAI